MVISSLIISSLIISSLMSIVTQYRCGNSSTIRKARNNNRTSIIEAIFFNYFHQKEYSRIPVLLFSTLCTMVSSPANRQYRTVKAGSFFTPTSATELAYSYNNIASQPIIAIKRSDLKINNVWAKKTTKLAVYLPCPSIHQ